MNHSRNHRQSPLAPFPRQPTPRAYHRVAEAPRTRHWHFLVMLAGKGLMSGSLVGKNQAWR